MKCSSSLVESVFSSCILAEPDTLEAHAPDHSSASRHTSAAAQRWHLHRGTVRYFIVGPGGDAWLACSQPDYTGRHPSITTRESDVANRAILILDRDARYDFNAGPREIRAAMRRARRELNAGTPFFQIEDPQNSPPATNRSVKLPAASDIAAILAAVASATRVPVAVIKDPARRTKAMSAAKFLTYAVIRSHFPHLRNIDIAGLIGHARNAVSYGLLRHIDLMATRPRYRRLFTRLTAS